MAYPIEKIRNIDGDKVTIKLPAWDAEKIYVFQVDGQKLTLTATDEYSPSYEMTKQ